MSGSGPLGQGGTGSHGTPPLHVRGILLPQGVPGQLWVDRGVLRREPVPGADTVADGGWILPGLVDAHCHVGLGPAGAVPVEVAEEQALTERDAGVLALRDAGVPADTRWMDAREDLPRIIRAGRHIARPRRYMRGYAEEIDPAQLVAEVETQARRGDGWVKLVGDWIDREVGDLAPLWPREVLGPAIARAHELGARVTAHVFGPDALDDLLDAGIDCLEHGTGLSDDQIQRMAAAGVALVPTRIQIDNFPGYADAGEPRYPAYAARMRHLYAGVDRTLAAAHEAGVAIYTGTDAGGVMAHGLLAAEAAALTGAGLSAGEAVAAASWRGRDWLGLPAGLADGDPADFVVYDADPREDIRTLASPRRIVLRGRVVR